MTDDSGLTIVVAAVPTSSAQARGAARNCQAETPAARATINSDERVSRMTIVVDGASTPVDQVHKQLEKLIRVLKVVELDEDAAIERELALIKVVVQPDVRAELLDIAASFRANVVDMGPETIVLEAVCSPGRLDSLLAQLDLHGTCELVRTGLIAIGRGSQTITDEKPEELAVCV